MIYIGGTEQTFEFDFGTKVAGSTRECPLKYYWSNAKGIKSPNDINGNAIIGFARVKGQISLDKLKSKNGISDETTARGVVGNYGQVMVELDLNPLAQDLFGGSNDALRNAMQSIEWSVYAGGSGAGGVGFNTAIFGFKNETGWCWSRSMESKDIHLLNKKVGRENNIQECISHNNKLYLLIHSKYPSDTNTPSQVLLDYVNIKVTLKREPDRIKPIPIDIKEKGSILVRFCPDFSCKQDYHGVFEINDGSHYNRMICHFGCKSENGLGIYSRKNNLSGEIWVLSTGDNYFYNVKTPYKPYKMVSIILSWDKTTKKAWRNILYDGSFNYKECKSDDMLTGNLNLYLGELMGGSNTFNGFIEDFQYMPNKTFTQEEMESILKGEHKYFEMPNMAKLSDFNTIQSKLICKIENEITFKNISTDNKEQFLMSPYIQLLPNNKYRVSFDYLCKDSCDFYILNNDSARSKRLIIKEVAKLSQNKMSHYEFEFEVSESDAKGTQYLRFDVNNTNSEMTIKNLQLKLVP